MSNNNNNKSNASQARKYRIPIGTNGRQQPTTLSSCSLQTEAKLSEIMYTSRYVCVWLCVGVKCVCASTAGHMSFMRWRVACRMPHAAQSTPFPIYILQQTKLWWWWRWSCQLFSVCAASAYVCVCVRQCGVLITFVSLTPLLRKQTKHK